MNSEPHVSVANLSRHFGPLCAVNDVSFELGKGEVLGFLGPNGAGKTTTMRIIAGALAPGSGQVHITGIDLIDNPQAAKANIGFLPETPPLYKELSVDDYLRYCARLRGIKGGAVEKAVDNAKSRCGLGHVSRRLLGNLSKGYQQRAGIAQAIIHAPAVVILDEPTVGLDPIQIREIRKLIRDLGKEHSVILSTHILPEVQAVCDRVQIIHQGSLVLEQSVSELGAALNSNSLRIRLRNSPTAEQLTAVAGVEAVELIDDQTWRVTQTNNADASEALVEAAVANQWGLYELTPEGQTLEEMFVRLTCSDDSDEPSEEAETT